MYLTYTFVSIVYLKFAVFKNYGITAIKSHEPYIRVPLTFYNYSFGPPTFNIKYYLYASVCPPTFKMLRTHLHIANGI